MGNRVFEQSIVIREGHLDTFGHVNNARYLEIFEQARWDLITDNGFGLDYVKASGTGPVILEINLRFLREVKNRQQVLVRSYLDSYEGKIGRMTQQLIDDSGQICCEAKFVIAQWDTATRKIILPTSGGARWAWTEARRLDLPKIATRKHAQARGPFRISRQNYRRGAWRAARNSCCSLSAHAYLVPPLRRRD